MANMRIVASIEPAGNFPVTLASYIEVTGGVRLDTVINQIKQQIENLDIDAYTKSESDAKFEVKGTSYSKAETDAKYEVKGTSYSKSEVDTKLDGKIDAREGYGLLSDDRKRQIQTNSDDIAELKTEVASLPSAETVSQLQTDMAVQTARMDALVDTEASADEVVDARVDFNGKNWGNLGNAVRGITGELKEDLKGVVDRKNYWNILDALSIAEKININYIENANAVEGKYYPSATTIGSNEQYVAIKTRIPIKKGVKYYWRYIHAYFSFAVYDDGSNARLSENTSITAEGSYTAANDGYVIISALKTRHNAKNVIFTDSFEMYTNATYVSYFNPNFVQNADLEKSLKGIVKGEDYLIDFVDLQLKQGVMRTTGQIVSQSQTVYTQHKISVTNGETLYFDASKYKVDIMGYDNIADESSSVETGYLSFSPIRLEQKMQKPYVILNIRKIDESALTPSEAIDDIIVAISESSDLITNDKMQRDLEVFSRDLVKIAVGKNKINPNNPTIVDGKYVGYTDGIEKTNTSFQYMVVPCLPDTDYAVNKPSIQIGFFSEYPLAGFISGAFSASAFTFRTPANAKFMTVSYSTNFLTSLQLELGTESTAYEPYSAGVNGSEILDASIDKSKLAFDVDATETKTVTVDINGGGDYTSLRTAFAEVALLANKKTHYIIYLKEGTYDVNSYYSSSEWATETTSFIGLVVPDYTTLVGIGNKENVIITASDTVQRQFISALNLRNTSGLENLTVKAKNLRYTIHDDFAVAGQERYERVIDNCDFYGESLQRTYVYGCGIKEGAEYKITNCRFVTDVENFSFLIHNNTNWNRCSNVLIENCRFEPFTTSDGVILSSLGTETKLTYVTMKGNKMKRMRLNENAPASFGKGISFKVGGYCNVIPGGVQIINTDDVDYSSYVDLI